MVPMTLGGGSSARRAGVTASTAGPRALGAHGGPARAAGGAGSA